MTPEVKKLQEIVANSEIVVTKLPPGPKAKWVADTIPVTTFQLVNGHSRKGLFHKQDAYD